MQNKKGYSLVELTIVVGLVSVLSITISAIVLTTIVNSRRIKTQIRLRQAGDYATGQMGTLIRNSRSVVACDSATDSVTIQSPDTKTTMIYMDTDSNQIASNSGIFMTPSDTEISTFDIQCLPSDIDVRLVNITFSLKKAGPASENATENPVEKFSTSAEVRNY